MQARLGAAQVRIECADALVWMARQVGADFDLVLLDPPFDGELWDAALAASRGLVADTGTVYLEADRPFAADVLAPFGLALHRHARVGRVHGHLLRRVGPTAVSA